MIAHILFILCVLSLFTFKKNRTLTVVFFLLFLFSALRFEYGNDYLSYEHWFNIIEKTGKNVFGTQTGFQFLNKISPTYQFMLTLISAFSLIVICKMVKKNLKENYYFIAIFIFLFNPYIFLMSLSALRQTIAMILLIIAVKFSFERKLILYLITIWFATLFHTSAIVLFPIYLIANDKKIGMFIMTIYIMAVFVLLTSAEAFPSAMEFVLNIFDEKQYSLYYDGGMTNSLRATLLSGIFLLYVILNINKLDGKMQAFARIYLVGLTFSVLAYKMSMLTRITQYFDIFSILVIPGIMKKNEHYEYKDYFSSILNKYALPTLIFTIYILRYGSFFTNELWDSFHTYKWILFR